LEWASGESTEAAKGGAQADGGARPVPRYKGSVSATGSRVMAPKHNPLKLNSLQLRTLTLLQELAQSTTTSTRDEATGEVRIVNFPHPHGNHFHIGAAIAFSKDANGLRNEAVWKALERKGLARSHYPVALVLTPAGLDYDTRLKNVILVRPDH